MWFGLCKLVEGRLNLGGEVVGCYMPAEGGLGDAECGRDGKADSHHAGEAGGLGADCAFVGLANGIEGDNV